MKVKKVEIIKKHRTIFPKFSIDLNDMTVITGKNNSGKTNFIKAINEGKAIFYNGKRKLKPDVIYIPAEQIQPTEDALKYTNKTSSLIVNLSKLFNSLGVNFEFKEKNKIKKNIEDLIVKVNENIERITNSDSHKIRINPSLSISSNILIQNIISKIVGIEDGREINFKDLGQGIQRVIVVSILKSYSDLLIDREIKKGGLTLILLEEPEVYLHPELKRSLNEVLENIATNKNHQVIITTHDPYFTFNNSENLDKKILSFSKVNNKTISDSGIQGIEDELLHIYLIGKVLKKRNESITDFDEYLKKDNKIKIFKYKRIDNNGNLKTENKSLPVYIRHLIHHPENKYTKSGANKKYTYQELEDSIKILNNNLI